MFVGFFAVQLPFAQKCPVNLGRFEQQLKVGFRTVLLYY